MVERSLQASPAGIQAAKTALISFSLNQQELATRLRITRQPVSKFFNGKPVDRNLFVQICETLKLNWQEISGQSKANTKSHQADIDALVQNIREKIKPLIQERCGTMKVLDMTQPIALTGEQGIYTHVNILEKITGRRRLGLEQLLQGCELEEFDRFGLSRVTEKRVPGLEAVKRYSKLMVLGKPGAGKTTFLKYLAMQCIEASFQADCIPLFITLKNFAETEIQSNFLDYINHVVTGLLGETNDQLALKNQEVIQASIKQGRLLILLDGLDEVREEDTKRILRQIRDFAYQFPKNQFVITCRIAAKEYTFESFFEVEVADFDDKQINKFIENWFNCREPQNADQSTKKLIKKLKENKPIKELATNPLLLTLLCLEFEELLDFPTNRAELYDRGLGVLLSKWDTSRRIERDQVYKKLSLKRKEDLLSQIALTTFQEKDYFFKQKLVESYIADYIGNLPDAQAEPEILQMDGEAILKSIEAQHGLLIERAKGIYSFSHLTFQEYFAAREIYTTSDYEKLVEHVTEKRWREVFLLTAGMMRKADELLKLMKKKVDELISKDSKVQSVIRWITQKSKCVDSSYKVSAIRSFYFEASHACNLELDYKLASKVDYNFYRDLYHERVLEIDLEFDRGIVFTLELAREMDCFPEIMDDFLIQLDRLVELSTHLSSKLENTLHELVEEVYKYHYKKLDGGESAFRKWWSQSSQSWIEKLISLMFQYRNIGHDWKLNSRQKQLLQKYYNANLLLVDCLNSDCYVSREVRQEIEDTLLLPIAEIEKYKAAKAAQQSD